MKKLVIMTIDGEVKYGSEGCKWDKIEPKQLKTLIPISPAQFNKVMNDWWELELEVPTDAYKYFMEHYQE